MTQGDVIRKMTNEQIARLLQQTYEDGMFDALRCKGLPTTANENRKRWQEWVNYDMGDEGGRMNGFLDTEGKLHECNFYGHLDKALAIVERMGVPVKNELEAEEYLQKLGWLVIRTNSVYGFIGYFQENSNTLRYHLTDAQKKWLNKFYEYMTDECRESVDMLFDMDK